MLLSTVVLPINIYTAVCFQLFWDNGPPSSKWIPLNKVHIWSFSFKVSVCLPINNVTMSSCYCFWRNWQHDIYFEWWEVMVYVSLYTHYDDERGSGCLLPLCHRTIFTSYCLISHSASERLLLRCLRALGFICANLGRHRLIQLLTILASIHLYSDVGW